MKNKWSLTRIKIISQLLFSTLRCPWTPWIPTPKWHNWQHLFWVHGISLSSFLPSIYLFILTLINCISVLWLLWLVFSAPMSFFTGQSTKSHKWWEQVWSKRIYEWTSRRLYNNKRVTLDMVFFFLACTHYTLNFKVHMSKLYYFLNRLATILYLKHIIFWDGRVQFVIVNSWTNVFLFYFSI